MQQRDASEKQRCGLAVRKVTVASVVGEGSEATLTLKHHQLGEEGCLHLCVSCGRIRSHLSPRTLHIEDFDLVHWCNIEIKYKNDMRKNKNEQYKSLLKHVCLSMCFHAGRNHCANVPGMFREVFGSMGDTDFV